MNPVNRHREIGLRKRTMAAIIVALGVCCLLSLSPLAATVAEAEQIGGMTVKEQRDARVFLGTLDSVYTLSTWEFDEQEDVPYVSMKEYVNLLFVDKYDPMQTFSWDGDVYKITRNDTNVLVDTANQTISCENWSAFLGPNASDATANGIVEKDEFVAMRPSAKNESTQAPAQGYEVHLKDYGTEMVRSDEDVLMPFAVVQAIFAGPASGGMLAYNGDDYYDIVNSVDSIYGNVNMTDAPNPYANMWYSGSFASRQELSEAYAKYNYAGMCLLLDLTYGHKEEKGITSFDSYLEQNGLKEPLLTPDPKDDVEALTKLFSILFDSGHDAEILSASIIDSEGAIGRADLIHEILGYIGYDTLADLTSDLSPLLNKLMELMTESKGSDSVEEKMASEAGPNVTELMTNSMRLGALKPFGYGEDRVDIEGDTCVIYFEHFKEDLTRSQSYYAKLPTEQDLETSSFALFYHAFEKIKKDGNVKNVVIDLSNNGGGSAAALVATLGFLSNDGEVKITYNDVLNKNYHTEYYHVDTNLDGRFDDDDGFGGQYNFYVLTTGLSYSCGNAFPYFAQKENMAKIVGEHPGGGDCCVANYVDAYGRVGGISGFKKLGTLEGDTFTSDETAVVVDIPLTKEEGDATYFHPEKIAQLVSGQSK